MKIVSARIRNFKLLRRIDLDFSIDPNKPLTVIRAENGSGKTSTLQALRWALYGNDVLDDPLVRLSPSYWPDKEPCEISIEIDFIHTAVSKVNGERMVAQTNYMLKREVVEKPEGDRPNRTPGRVTLFEKSEAGAEPVEAAESRLAQMLPKEMIDIFFTDGDAAMTFISPQLSEDTKRDKVKDAIRSLLGLDLLERVDKRIKDAQSNVNRSIARDASSTRLSEVTEEIENANKQKEELSEQVSAISKQIEETDKKLSVVTKELARALEAGSYEHLSHQRETFKKQRDDALDEDEALKKRHQLLFQDEKLSWGLISPVLKAGYSHLESLHAKGIIPRAAVPVLEERLQLKKCFCGTDLSEGTQARDHVCELLEQHRETDKEVDYLSSIYFQGKSEIEDWESGDSETWKELVSSLQQQRVLANKRIETASRELKSIEAKLDQIDEEEIEEKRSYEKLLQSTLQTKGRELDRKSIELKNVEEKLKELVREQNDLRKADERMLSLNAEKTVLNDLQKVVEGALSEMQGTYLKKVSDKMNSLFLEMVGADPEQGAIFQGAEINERYNIVVKTKDNRTLNPDFEVNGASQRALTFAFIWALTEVSGVIAPRVIDTPLGMMSGNVKRRVLERVSQSAGEEVDRQVILFLTQSEISHTEDILDRQTGEVCTLIKTDDFPADLMNDPKAQESEVRKCGCNHRQYCVQCQRTNYSDYDLDFHSA